jgi:hypothetical protein
MRGHDTTIAFWRDNILIIDDLGLKIEDSKPGIEDWQKPILPSLLFSF